MNIRKRLRPHAEVHTGALNDILFILLLFFLIVSTLANPNVMKVGIPRGKSDTKAKQTVVVSVDAAGQYYIGQKKISADELENSLRSILEKETDKPSVVINVDTAAHYGDFFRILRVAKSLGANAVASVQQ